MLPNGYVSFAGDDLGRIDAPTVDTKELAVKEISKLKNGDSLLAEMYKLDKLVPVTYDRTPAVIQNQLWGKEKTGELAQSLGIIDENCLQATFINSYFEIVTETYFTDDSCLYITEKTLRPIIFMRPFIHVGTPFVLAKLRNYGFKTFAPWINESYDVVVDPVKRMDLILDEINRLGSLTGDDLKQFYDNCWDSLSHNIKIFTTQGCYMLSAVETFDLV